ncbi:putative Co/Zn/Cd efflux system membrane fusion protein (plasmid) [Rhodovulum sp. P5]|uniref:copper-binding protein n=1 Tax=Rhodovulum sp. P5 TaxID=1564506 RepID=UPI0009C374E7|nr:copper-binding protein [Rhodovulum sp. P5]ARE42407.1 putative Co/Zn/Cd efflux system membrane fusion protein [Rhodovulum sp. P5]
MTLLLISLTAIGLSATATFAQMSHGMDHSDMPMSAEQMEGAVHTEAVVNSIGGGMANVSHEPIPEIGWPAMTMDLPLLENADMMGDVAAGDRVTLMLVKGADGMYAIGGMMRN